MLVVLHSCYPSPQFALTPCLFTTLHALALVAQERAEELVTLTQQQAFPQWGAVGAFRRGQILAQHGSAIEGIQQMQQALTAFHATGAKLWLPLFSCDLAWAYARAGQERAGLPLLTAAQTVIEKTGERFYAAELFRIKGEVRLQQEWRQTEASAALALTP